VTDLVRDWEFALQALNEKGYEEFKIENRAREDCNAFLNC